MLANERNLLHHIRWTLDKIRLRLQVIEPLVYRKRQLLPQFRYLALDNASVEPPMSPLPGDAGWTDIPWESYWGAPDTDFVLYTTFQVPAGWATGDRLALNLPIGKAGDFSHPDTLAYLDGQPYASCDRHHQEIRLPERVVDGEPHDLTLHGWTGGTPDFNFSKPGSALPERAPKLFMSRCEIVQIHQPTRDLIALARVALGVASDLDPQEPTRGHLCNALDEAFKVLDTLEPFGDRFYDSVPAALETLRAGIARSGGPLDVDVTAAGHAHIDVAWLWTLGQTRRKVGRTFHNVMRLMEQFPDFCFTQSQPQLYQFALEDYAELFDDIKLRVHEGRWEPIGGMWVEADCNLSGPESLARQFLLGQSFFRKYFGEQSSAPVLWLPDVFGYAWNLPQLIKEAGLQYFFTIKIGWSQYNRLPYDSFWWQGLDGTRVLTHFSPTREGSSAFASTYNSMVTPQEVRSTWTNFQQKDWGRPGVTPPLLLSYGFGDGGGGPTREMLENLQEVKAFPATPRVHCGTVGGFFRDLERKVGDRLPTWNGELYMEYHRGTYTTQARNKRANRKSEFRLHDAEFLASWASLLDPDYDYPHADLGRAWEMVCLNQFHDIIPGSSIGAVYEESLTQYAEVASLADGAKQGALATIASRLGGDLLLVNPTSFARGDLALWAGGKREGNSLSRSDGAPVKVQVVEGGLLLDAGQLPPYSATPLAWSDVVAPGSEPQPLRAAPNLLENAYLRVEVDAAGDITRIYDKENVREVVVPGTPANQFQAFEDRPRTPDAWDIDIYYDDRVWLAEPARSVRVVEAGPLRATLEVQRRVLHSDYVQRISLVHNARRLDFDTVIQWQERHVMLKVAFPVDVLSPVATYEIQWGNVERPTHRNHSWAWAQFEVAAQKWVDLSEGGYGVSLLNDCKYGHDIRDRVMRITLLRSTTEPDPTADLGEHRFAYSLLPHDGRWDQRTVAQAYALNDPLLVWAGGVAGDPASPAEIPSLVQVDCPNIVIETVKQAEDGRGIVVRLYECQRKRSAFTLSTGFGLAAAWRTNLLEDDREALACEERALRLTIQPYQIVTLRLLSQ